jgi:hypothetical protein
VPVGIEGVLGVVWPVVVVVVESAGVVCVAAPETVAATLVCATLVPASVTSAQANVMNFVLVTG